MTSYVLTNPEDYELELDDELEEVSDVEDFLAEVAELLKDEGIEDDVASQDGNLKSEPDVNFIPKEPEINVNFTIEKDQNKSLL